MTTTAFDALPWDAFAARLRAYVARRVPAADVDDLVGDILLKVTRRRDDLLAARDPIAWLITVARNAVADHLRRRVLEERLKEQLALDAGRHADESDAVVDQISVCLEPLIDRLPPKYARALRMTAIDGCSQVEAAAAERISVSGMKSRVQRARRLLGKALFQCCPQFQDGQDAELHDDGECQSCAIGH